MKVSLAQMKRSGRADEQILYVRISHHGAVRYVSLQVAVRPRDWNVKRQEVRASHRDADDLNELLRARLALAERTAREAVLTDGGNVDVDAVKGRVAAVIHPVAEREKSVPILPWMRREVKREYLDRGKVSTALAYTSVLNRLEESLTAQSVRVDRLTALDLTADRLRKHRDRLEAPKEKDTPGVGRGEGHAVNYVHKQITTLRALLARAERDGVPGAGEALRAAQAVKVSKETPDRVRVPIETVRAYAGLELAGRAADVRDWWVFAFFAGGMRLGDVCRLRWTDIERDGDGAPVGYRMRQQKTGAPMVLPLAPEAAGILRRWESRTLDGVAPPVDVSVYVFGLLDEADERDAARLRTAVDKRGALARRYLARITKREGWPALGFHSARHSLADHMRVAGADLYSISKVLGHTKLSTTESYLSTFDNATVGAALLSALGSLGAHAAREEEPSVDGETSESGDADERSRPLGRSRPK